MSDTSLDRAHQTILSIILDAKDEYVSALTQVRTTLERDNEKLALLRGHLQPHDQVPSVREILSPLPATNTNAMMFLNYCQFLLRPSGDHHSPVAHTLLDILSRLFSTMNRRNRLRAGGTA